MLSAYPAHIARMLGLVFGGDAAGHADTAARIVALETKLAGAHWDVVKRRDADLTYNLRSFAELQNEAPGFDWAGWVDGLGGTVEILGLFANEFNLAGGFWNAMANFNINTAGFVIVGHFVVSWVAALAIWRFGRIEERWEMAALRARAAGQADSDS